MAPLCLHPTASRSVRPTAADTLTSPDFVQLTCRGGGQCSTSQPSLPPAPRDAQRRTQLSQRSRQSILQSCQPPVGLAAVWSAAWTGLAACPSWATEDVASSTTKQDGGWLAPLTDTLEAGLRVIQAGLDTLHVPYSYGYSIILLTLAVKILTFPLTKQQVESNLAVQSLKPRIDLIKARYGEDKDKVSKETSLLYEQAGVNPLAGCLPTLATIPIFIGLYRSLTNVANAGLLEDQGFYWIPSLAGPTDMTTRGTAWLLPLVDGAPPIGWDLASAYVSLPVLLVLTQYLSTALVSTPLDPEDPNSNTTKVLNTFLPLMVGYFALNVPAGLGLYYLTNTVLTMVVQLYLRKLGGAQVDVKDLGPVTKPGSGRRTGPEATAFTRWQSETAAAVAAARAAELAREDEQEVAMAAMAAQREASVAQAAEGGVGEQAPAAEGVSWYVKRKKLALISRA